MKHFKPVLVCKKFKLKHRHAYEWKLVPRREPSHDIIERIMGDLHYLGSHSFVMDKWNKIERKFFNAHRRRDF